MSTPASLPPAAAPRAPKTSAFRWLRRFLRAGLLACLVGWSALYLLGEPPVADPGDELLLSVTLAQTESYGQPKAFLGPPGAIPLPEIQAVGVKSAPPVLEMRPRRLRIELHGGVPATALYELFTALELAFPGGVVPAHELSLLPE